MRAASVGVLALYAVAIRDASVGVGFVGAAPLANSGASSSPGGSAKDRPRRPGVPNMTPEERASHAAHREGLSRRMQERRRKAREDIKRRNAEGRNAKPKDAAGAEAKAKSGPAGPEGRKKAPFDGRKLDGMRPNGKIERLSKEEMERIAEEAKSAAANSIRATKARQAKAKAEAEGKSFASEDATDGAGGGEGSPTEGRRRLKKTPEAERDAASSTRNYDWMRRAYSFGGNSDVPSNYNPYYIQGMADPGDEYDWWSQGYRFLGGYIDCDHGRSNKHNWRERDLKEGDAEYDQNERDLSGSHDGEGYYGCQRWAMWASYVNPNYQGGGRDEYFDCDDSNGGCSSLDCHDPDTEWVLLGVYRQEFYQFVEQISKHLWAIDSYEYVVALAGLAYMTDYDCWQVQDQNDGSYFYAGTKPTKYGRWEMGLYTDQYCLEEYEDGAYTYDNMGMGSDLNLGSKDETGCSNGDRRKLDDGGDDDGGNDNGGGMSCDDLENYWDSTQEYTLTNLNNVYETFKYCTPCMDYPTYQDGYFIGDYGTDDDDLINQCWKFHSHDSFVCEGDCVNMGHSQGTILEIEIEGRTFGNSWDSSSSSMGSNPNYNSGQQNQKHGLTKLDKLKANLFVGFAGILFVATFLAFAVARGSGRKDRSGKSRSLLTSEERARARRRSRSKGRTASASRGDRSSRSRSSRSKSRGASSRSKSASRSKSRGASSRSKSASRSRSERESSGRSPRSEGVGRERSSSRRSSSRRARSSSKFVDEF